MAFNPTLPADASPLSAAEMRAQFNGLNDFCNDKPSLFAFNNAIASTSANSNAVALLGLTVSDPPTRSEVQQIADKLDELINALRR